MRARIKDSLGDKKAATEDYIEAVKYKSPEDSADEEIVQEFRKATSNASQIIQTSPDFAYTYYRGLAGKKRDIEIVEIEKSGIEITGDMNTDSSLVITENLSQATQLKPGSAEAFYYKGLSERYLPAEAIADLTQAIQLNPNFLEAYLFRGLIQSKDSINQGDRDTLSAIRDFSQVIKLNPNLANAYYQRGVLLSKLMDDAHAIQNLSKALSIDSKKRSTIYNQNEVEECLSTLKNAPKTAKNYLDRGIVRHKLGDILGSRADLNRAIRLNPKLSEAYFERALLAQSLLRSTDALSDFNQAIRLNPNFGDAHFERALLYTHWSAGGPLREQKPQMFADLDITIRLNSQLAAQGFFALGASRENFSKQSLGDYLQAVFLDPNFYEAYAYSHTYSQGWNNGGSLIQPYSVSNFIKSERQNAEYLVKERTQTIQRNPQDAIAFYSRGHAQLKLGQLQAAEEDFTQAIQINPDEAIAFSARAFVRFRLKNFRKAIEDSSQAIRINPELADAYLVRGFAWYELGDKQKAFEDATQAVHLDRGLAAAHLIRWLVREDLGDKKGAKRDRSMFIGDSPCLAGCGAGSALQGNPDALYEKGRTFALKGDRQKAIQNLKQAISLFRTGRGTIQKYQEAQQLLQKIQ